MSPRHVKNNLRRVRNYFVALESVARRPTKETVRDRIKELFATRQDLTDDQLATLIGVRGGNWVNAIKHDRRYANDIEVLTRIASAFKVPLSYLFDDSSDTDTPPLVRQISSICAGLSEEHQRIVLNLARSLPQQADGDRDGPMPPR